MRSDGKEDPLRGTVPDPDLRTERRKPKTLREAAAEVVYDPYFKEHWYQCIEDLREILEREKS